MKIYLEGEMVNMHHRRVAKREEKIRFWDEVNEEVAEISSQEQLWIGGDFNGHIGSESTGAEEAIGRYGCGVRNEEAETIIDVALSTGLSISSTFFKKAERHRLTYKSGGRKSQIDVILYRKGSRRAIKGCKEIL